MLIQWITIGVLGSGVVVTSIGLIKLWIKNGRDAARRDGVLDTKLKGISIIQTETRNDIANLSRDVNEQKQHCASVTSGFFERIKDLEGR